MAGFLFGGGGGKGKVSEVRERGKSKPRDPQPVEKSKTVPLQREGKKSVKRGGGPVRGTLESRNETNTQKGERRKADPLEAFHFGYFSEQEEGFMEGRLKEKRRKS